MRALLLTAALACSLWLPGCAIPYSREFKPKWYTHIPNRDGTAFHRLTQPTKLVDADTSEEIGDASAVIVIQRTKYASSREAARSSAERPRVEVERFSELDAVTYPQSGVFLFPLYDLAAEYTGARIYIYKRGYEPVPYVTRYCWIWSAPRSRPKSGNATQRKRCSISCGRRALRSSADGDDAC